MGTGQPYRVPNRRSRITTALALGAAVVAAACGSTSVTDVAGPDVIRCAATVNATPTTVPPEGATVTVTVAAARDCTWTARSDASWLQVRSTSGQGDGTFAATVGRNDLISARSGGIIVNDQRLGVTQEGRACSYELTGPGEPVGPAGARRMAAVSTVAGCTWTAESSVPWIVLVNGTGSGSGTIAFDVLPNPGAARESAITLANRSYVVSQAAAVTAPACTFTIAPPAQNFAVAGGEGSVAVSTGPDCSWTVEGGSTWTRVLAGSGTGSGTARYAVEPNPSITERTTTLTIAGRVHTVTQQGLACTFTLSPGSQPFPAGGGFAAIEVDTLPGCTWTASSSAGWIAVGAISGAGPGTVPYTVQANTETTPRSASIAVGGQVHAVTQDAAAPVCTYALDPPARSFTAAGVPSAVVRVNTAAGCGWTASSTVPWVVVATPAGTGTSDISYSVEANASTTARSGAITVGGQSHDITQEAAAPCSYVLSPAERSFGPEGGGAVVGVTTGETCSWKATSSAPWLVVATGGGVGTSEISYTVERFDAGGTRTATITVNGQVHTVVQTGGTSEPAP